MEENGGEPACSGSTELICQKWLKMKGISSNRMQNKYLICMVAATVREREGEGERFVFIHFLFDE